MDGTVIVNIPRRFWFPRKQGFQFTMGTWMLLSDYTQLALNEFGLLENERFLSAVFYCAARCYSVRGGPWRYTEQDVKRWVECMPMKEAQKIMDAMWSSKIGGESLMELLEKSDEKKKSGPVKLKTTPSDTSG
jgi:hypothetical protein